MTVADKVIEFYGNFPKLELFSSKLQFHNPYDAPSRAEAIGKFCAKYYSDSSPRTHLVGINPIRLTNTSTGVNYTDGYALEHKCGIPNEFSKSRELTSSFFYDVVDAAGGAVAFYSAVFAWAVMPVALTFEGEYANYYEVDDDRVDDVIAMNMAWLSALPKRGRLVVLGSGQNKSIVGKMEGVADAYNEIIYLPHPRWIMQYNREKAGHYVCEYINALLS